MLSNFAYLYIQQCRDIGMLNGDKALLRISMAGRGQILITIEPHGVF